MGKGLVILALVSVFLAYQVYQEPVPDGMAEPILLRVILALNKLCRVLSYVIGKLGITSEAVALREISEIGAKLLITSLDGVTSEDTEFDGIKVRVYRPTNPKQDEYTGMVYYHGGGWTIGSIDTHNSVTEFFAKEANMVVVSVEYRLSPEFSPYDGLEDCTTATKYFLKNAKKFGVDPNRVAISGDSAGGNYAAAISLILRDSGFTPVPKLQVLIYPTVQGIDLQLPSYQQNNRAPFLDKQLMNWFKSHANRRGTDLIPYFKENTHVIRQVREEMAKSILNHNLLPKENLYPPYKPIDGYEEGDIMIWDYLKDAFLDPYRYPLMAKDHSNLPEAYVFTGHYDPLRDEGFLYVRKLKEAGVKVTHYNSPVGWHSMINFWRFFSQSEDLLRTISVFIKENL